MKRLRVSHVVLGALAVAAAGKIGQLGVSIPGPDQHATMASALSVISPASAAASEEPAEPMAETAPQVCEAPEAVFAEIKRERELLVQQSDALLQQEARLQIGEEKLAADAQQLRDLKTALEALLAKVEEQQSADLDRLVNLYRNMKPKDAAEIINEMDIEISVLVLGSMPERDAAPILAGIDTARARAISKILVERSKLPGDQDFTGLRLQ
ncbi:MAG: hypothetical protein AAFQ60_00370 [Pseudomonadota bacterium]